MHEVQRGRWELVDQRWRICGLKWSEEGCGGSRRGVDARKRWEISEWVGVNGSMWRMNNTEMEIDEL